MAPFSVVKSEVVSFFVIKWPPNLMSIATLNGNSGSKSDEKLVPNIIDKNRGELNALGSVLGLKDKVALKRYIQVSDQKSQKEVRKESTEEHSPESLPAPRKSRRRRKKSRHGGKESSFQCKEGS